MLRIALALSVAAMCVAGAAAADEVIQTHSTEGPAAEAPRQPYDPIQSKRQADGDWARGVLAGTNGKDDAQDADAKSGGCQRNPDRRQHGEAWAGVGTGGYNDVGVVVTQPIGDCGQVTVAASHTNYGNGGHWRGGHR